MTPLTLTVHDPTKLNFEERLEIAWHDAECALFAAPEDPSPVAVSGARELGFAAEDEGKRVVLARAGGRLVGRAYLSYALSQNTDKGFLGVTVHPEFRRRGLGRALALRAGQLALDLGRTVYSAGTSTREPQGEGFAAGLGAKAALPMLISELRLDTLDHNQLQHWVQRPEGDAYALHRFTRIPEHELERVAAIMEVMNTAPRGDLEFDDWKITPTMVASWQAMTEVSGDKCLLYAAEHLKSGELVGYTEVFWHPERAALVYQGATGVRLDHRGQGLGKWLKAAVLLDLPAHNPAGQRLRTGNVDSNAAMLGINRALGFAPVFGRTEWQGQTEELVAAARRASGEETLRSAKLSL